MDTDTKKFIIDQLKRQRQTLEGYIEAQLKHHTRETTSAIEDSAGATATELKKYVTAGLRENSDELQRYIGGLTEHHQHEVDAIGEQYSDIKKAQYEHTSVLTANQETLLEHDQLLNDIRNSLKNIEVHLVRHSHKISALETK